MKSDGINLARRRSGGGAVYQDLNNTCFTFINPVTNPDEPPMASRDTNNKILLRSLKNLGIEAQLSGRNDIECDGYKVSSNPSPPDIRFSLQSGASHKTGPNRTDAASWHHAHKRGFSRSRLISQPIKTEAGLQGNLLSGLSCDEHH